MSKLLGDLAVRLSAKTQGWAEAFQRAADSVTEVADEVEELASKGAAALGDMSDGLLTMSAAAVGAFVLGAKGNQKMADAMEELEDVTRTLAVTFGKDLVPLVKDITSLLKDAVATYRNLSKGQRQAIVDGVKWAFILGTGTKALERGLMFGKSFFEMSVALSRTYTAASPVILRGLTSIGKAASSMGADIAKGAKSAAVAIGDLGKMDVSRAKDALSGLGSSISSKFDGGSIGAGVDRLAADAARAAMNMPSMLAGAGASFSAMAAAAAPVLAAVLAITAAVGALVVLAAVLRDTWDQTGDGLAGHFRYMGMVADEMAGKVAEFVSGLFTSLKAFLMRGTQQALDLIAAGLRWLATAGRGLAKSLGLNEAVKKFDELAQASGKKMMEYVEKGANAAWSATTQVVGAVSGLASDIATKTKAGINIAGKTVAETLRTSMESAKRGFKLLDDDLGLSGIVSNVKGFFSGFGDSIPSRGDGSGVEGTKTLEDVAKAAKAAKELADLAAAAAEDSRAQYIASVRAEAHSAAENFRDLGRMAEDARRDIEDARRQVIDKVLGGLGTLGGLIQNAMQKIMSGDIVGAVASVVLDLLMQSEGFRTVVDMLNVVMQTLADDLGAYLVPLQSLIGAVSMIVRVVGEAVAPALMFFGEMLGSISPLVATVGILLAGLAPVFAIATSLIKAFYSPVTLLINEALPLLFEGVKLLGLGILYVVRAISWAWNSMLGAVIGVLIGLANAALKIPFVGDEIFEALAGLASDLMGHRIDMGEIIKSIDDLENLTWEGAMDAAAQAAWDLKDSMSALNSEVLNAPVMWKRNLAAANAQSGQASPYASRPSTGGATPTPASTTPRPADAGVTTQTVIYSYDPESTARAVSRVNNGASFRARAQHAES